MRGADIQQDTLFSTVIPEERVPADHTLRPVREKVNTAQKALDPVRGSGNGMLLCYDESDQVTA